MKKAKGIPLTPFMKAALKKFADKRLRVHKKIQKTIKLAGKQYYQSFKIDKRDENA